MIEAFFFFNDTATTEIYTLSLHDALPILTAEQDQLLQQEFLRRNDLGGNVFLLMRHTGMRIGECADLSVDCLRSTGPNQRAIQDRKSTRLNSSHGYISYDVFCLNKKKQLH